MAVDNTDKDLISIAAASVSGVAAVRDVNIIRKPMGTDVDVFADIKYGSLIPEVAWNLQQKILEVLEDRFNRKTDRINIRITGVIFDSPEEINAQN